jgi:translocation and assembly module TamB
MAAGSAIEKAEINDEVSTRVLSYIAPVLHKATQVRGFVSVQLDRAEIPLWGGGERQPNVDGTITFHDVVYGPGTLAKQLLTLSGKGQNLGLRLDQAVKIQVADGRVTQSGLAIDMGNDVKVDLAGSVGFDHTLKMKAEVPVTGAMLGNQAALQEIVGGTRVGIPIGGTMTHPAIDQQALRVGLRDQSREIIKRSATRGVGQVLDRVSGTRGAAGGSGSGANPAAQLLDRFTGTRGAGAGAGTGSEGAPAGSIPRDLRGLEDEALRRLLPTRRNARPR